MNARHPYGENLCQRKSVFSLWFLCFFAANCFFQLKRPSHDFLLCALLPTSAPSGLFGDVMFILTQIISGQFPQNLSDGTAHSNRPRMATEAHA